MTDAEILDAFDMPGLNIEASFEPRELELFLQAARELSAPTQGADARPVAVYQIRASRFVSDWTDVSSLDPRFHDYPEELRRIVYATRDAAPSDAQARLDWLREYHCSPLSDEEIDKVIAAIAPREET